METRRLIIAVGLSMAIWFLWMKFFYKPVEPPIVEPPVKTEEVRKDKATQPLKPVSSVIVTNVSAAKEESCELNTDKYAVRFSNKGAAITSFKYKERNVELVVGSNKYNANGNLTFSLYFSDKDFFNGTTLDDALWKMQTEQNTVKFSTSININNNPLILVKTYIFNKEGYFFKVDYAIINKTNKEVVLPGGYIIASPSEFLGPDVDFNNTYNELNSVYYTNESLQKGSKGGGFFSKEEDLKIEKDRMEWVGIMSRYFLLLMIPDNAGSGVVYDGRSNYPFKTGMYVNVDKFKPGEVWTKSFKIYAGEKNKDKLAAVDNKITDAADVSSWIEPIRDFLLWSLIKINILFGNFGWSLVVFSILTKLILLPLTLKSNESMKKMQELTPKMNELKVKYKDKPEVLNREIMKMYKNNKVNPLGGCLPLLLQMPFFFALYSALINAIELWHSPFILWINDLSLPDTVYSVSGFNLNILPIIMTLTSFFQQKLTTTTAATSQQQKMMMFMPLMFIVIFWNMPSGLVLYWTLQNVLQIMHQIYINKKTSTADAN